MASGVKGSAFPTLAELAAPVQTRRAETLPGFRAATPLHKTKKETPGEAPGVEFSLGSLLKAALTGL